MERVMRKHFGQTIKKLNIQANSFVLVFVVSLHPRLRPLLDELPQEMLEDLFPFFVEILDELNAVKAKILAIVETEDDAVRIIKHYRSNYNDSTLFIVRAVFTKRQPKAMPRASYGYVN